MPRLLRFIDQYLVSSAYTFGYELCNSHPTTTLFLGKPACVIALFAGFADTVTMTKCQKLIVQIHSTGA